MTPARFDVVIVGAGPASALKRSPSPSASIKPRLLAAMQSPHTLRRGKPCFSTSATDQPARASKIAAVDPAGPAPTMTTSKRAGVTARAPRQRAAQPENSG